MSLILKNYSVVSSRKYPAKLLLFGEYTVLSGGSALATPMPGLWGEWKKGKPDTALQNFFNYLRSLDFIDPEALDDRLVFQSCIPVGYGLGSSGALSAASYDKFAKTVPASTALLRSQLARVESFFHGQSSGLDPLVSYLERALLIRRGKLKILSSPLAMEGVFLFDSSSPRNTAGLISIYKEKKEKNRSFEAALEELVLLNEKACAAFSEGLSEEDILRQISTLQLQYFSEFIPDSVRPIWQKGLDEDSYYMKLCGAGGGGCFILFSDLTEEELLNKGLSLIRFPAKN